MTQTAPIGLVAVCIPKQGTVVVRGRLPTSCETEALTILTERDEMKKMRHKKVRRIRKTSRRVKTIHRIGGPKQRGRGR